MEEFIQEVGNYCLTLWQNSEWYVNLVMFMVFPLTSLASFFEFKIVVIFIALVVDILNWIRGVNNG